MANIDGKLKKIGAGGVGMGVKLAVSDKDDQERSKKMLANVLRDARQRRKMIEQNNNRS